ncbi:HAD family hydrolase [Streptomyces qaidamensis]|uniref:HAD family hydrolase n=1 Tax=Streptomyces qaidamensis TaxID=1783515 RepID=A0A143C2K5_9ACTN|nr:HAD family hydrolase [Streptomyces qaidamensis]AMW11319.1 HAD family hydrolase [Streptomyces qaidamensis]
MPEPTADDALVRLLAPTRAVLFDFDGPVCDLFGGESTRAVAQEVKRAAQRHWGTLDPDVSACDDSHGILLRLRDMYDRRSSRPRSRRPLELAEDIVTGQEARAVAGATPTPHVEALVDALSDLGMRLVMVSNNAEEPIRTYLKAHGLDTKFERIFGRDREDARRMKPDPHCIKRAREHLELPMASCLMVGDQLTDLKAARSAGACFLGYTRHEGRAEDMRQSGADFVVSSHLTVLAAAKRLLDSRSPERVR